MRAKVHSRLKGEWVERLEDVERIREVLLNHIGDNSLSENDTRVVNTGLKNTNAQIKLLHTLLNYTFSAKSFYQLCREIGLKEWRVNKIIEGTTQITLKERNSIEVFNNGNGRKLV